MIRELSGASFIRALIPFMRAPPSWPNHLPKSPPSITIILRVGVSAQEFWLDAQLQTTAPFIPGASMYLYVRLIMFLEKPMFLLLQIHSVFTVPFGNTCRGFKCPISCFLLSVVSVLSWDGSFGAELSISHHWTYFLSPSTSKTKYQKSGWQPWQFGLRAWEAFQQV